MPGWLQDIGARPPAEELEDSGFIYYGRHFRSADGSLPPLRASPLMHWDTISSLTLPADNGTWSVALVIGSKDAALRGLREPGRWQAVARSLPPVAHWLDGTPIDDGVQVMARLEDRYRGFVVDGRPVATGVVAVGDSWAVSNPVHGRGTSVGMRHAVALRDQLRAVGLDDPSAFADAFHAATAETVEPWYRATLATDRHRLGEIEAGIRGAVYEPGRWYGCVGLAGNNSHYAGMRRIVSRRPDGPGGRRRGRHRVRDHGRGAAGRAIARFSRLWPALAAPGTGAGRGRLPGRGP